MEQLSEQLEEEQAARAQLQQKLSKALTEGSGSKKGLDVEDAARVRTIRVWGFKKFLNENKSIWLS